MVYASKRKLQLDNECECECVVELDDIQGRNLYELRVITTFFNPAHLLRVDVALVDTLTVLSEATGYPVVDGKKATVTRIRFFVEPALPQELDIDAEEEPDYANWFQLQLTKDV